MGLLVDPIHHTLGLSKPLLWPPVSWEILGSLALLCSLGIEILLMGTPVPDLSECFGFWSHQVILWATRQVR